MTFAPTYGVSLTYAIVRTLSFVKLNIAATKLIDSVAVRITDMPYGLYKKNTAVWLQIMSWRHIGFSVGGLVHINCRFVLAVLGIIGTYCMLMWDGENCSPSIATGQSNDSLPR
ncbi:uncharacterized protein LOC129584455 [Paramacrobiotus metropolitanus]|uniref:uncharacterized protein LOC129584455 n=1 Tax=Paramacrobiotus metropolitanus TaxID=2943436 RepID=UPI002445CB05|nr:uncharacterized protein LOC129584455 [Paramacrobiotus metropolitanus]